MYAQATLDDIARSGLTEADAKLVGYEDVDKEWCADILQVPRAGYKIPYFTPDGKGLIYATSGKDGPTVAVKPDGTVVWREEPNWATRPATSGR